MKWLVLTVVAIAAFIFGVALFSPPKDINTPASVEKNIFVGGTTKLCRGEGTQRCLQIKEQPEDSWQNYHGKIEGFNHENGNEYHLRVQEETVPDAPDDVNSKQLVLIEILDWKEVSYIAITTPVDNDKVPLGEPFRVAGTGRGLFENNVRVSAGRGPNLFTNEVTTMITDEVGGEGTWELMITFKEFPQDTRGTINASSLSPKQGESGLSYGVPVVFSVTGGVFHPLDSTNWVLKGMMQEDGSLLEPAGEINAVFRDDGTLSGSSGCNNYSTSYKTNGIQIGISDQVVLTRMACPEPLMTQEQLYLKKLVGAGKYSLRGEELLIKNDLGEPLLIYNVVK